LTRQTICISHATGAGGTAIGRAVAERLGFRFADEEVISEAAEWAEIDPALVADAERRKPLVSRLLGGFGSGPERTPSGEVARMVPAEADLRSLIRVVLRSFADRGSVVLVSHAASYALADRGVLRVLVTASPETRARRVEEAGSDDGARQIKREDEARADYLKRFYGVEQELPFHYDLVINTDVLGTEEAAALIAAAAG
jgi:cytidylate kinase